MIGVIAVIKARPGKREEMYKAYQKLVPLVLANEPGCIEYIPMIDTKTDLGNQEPIRPDTIIVMEKWKDLDAFKAHTQTAHVLEYRKETEKLRESVAVHVLDPILI